MNDKTNQDIKSIINSILSNANAQYTTSHRTIREHKGQSIDKYVNDYSIVDIEMTDFSPYAEVIELGAVKVRNNQIIDTFDILIKPSCKIPTFITDLTGITNEMVETAPVLNEVIDDFLSFVGDDVIVGYNNASFDMCILYDSILKLRKEYFCNNYEDVLSVARRSLPQMENHRLETLCIYYGFDTKGNHRALADCYLIKQCYDKLYSDYGNEVFKNISKSSLGPMQYSSETLALKEFETIVSFLLNHSFNDDSIQIIRFWMNEHESLKKEFPFYKLQEILAEYDNLKDIQSTKMNIQALLMPVSNSNFYEEEIAFTNKHICLTGNFIYGTKLDVEKFILGQGGIIDKTIKKGTDYLIVGEAGNKNWAAENYGNKVKRAIELNNKGGHIKIIHETQAIEN